MKADENVCIKQRIILFGGTTEGRILAEKLQAAGYDEAVLYERKLLGISAMEKLVGRKKLTETLGDLIIRPAGKPVLVPESDKRPEINATASARADFDDEGLLPFN